MAEQNVGAIIALAPPAEGETAWQASQVDVVRNLPPGDIGGRIPIDWPWGPIKVTGYVDTNTFELYLTISVLGINVGNIFGNLKDGVCLKIDLFLASGKICFYLKNGKELWARVDLNITFDGSYHEDIKILDLPI